MNDHANLLSEHDPDEAPTGQYNPTKSGGHDADSPIEAPTEFIENDVETGVIFNHGNRRFIMWVGGLCLLGFLAWLTPDPGFMERGPAQDVQEEIKSDKLPEARRLITEQMVFYIPDRNNINLIKVSRPVNTPEELEEKIRMVVEELLKSKDTVNEIYPEGMSVRSVYVFKKTAFVSISSAFRKNYNSGVWTEIMAVDAIVNTICGNFSMIKEVKLLIDDMEEEIFAAHVDISGALNPDISMVKGPHAQKPATREKSFSPAKGSKPSKEIKSPGTAGKGPNNG